MKGTPLLLFVLISLLTSCNMPIASGLEVIKGGKLLGVSIDSSPNNSLINDADHLTDKNQLESQTNNTGNLFVTVTEQLAVETATETPIITSTIGASPSVTPTPPITPLTTITPTGTIKISVTVITTSTQTKTTRPQQSPTSTKTIPKTSTQTPTQKITSTITKTISPSKTATQTQIPTKTPMPTKTLVPTNTNTPVPQTCAPVVNTSFENEVVNLINQERANAGVAPLTVHSSLTSAARSHSQDMICNGFFDHNSPTTGSAFDRILAHGYSYSWAGENIIAGYLTPAYSVAWWMNSQAHKDNILNPNFTNIGIGYAYSDESHYGTYVTANFGSP